MLYARNGLARQTMKYVPERRKGTQNGWETVYCQSLSFLARKLPGKASNRQITKTHMVRLGNILQEWDVAEESGEEQEEEEGDEEGMQEDEEDEDPSYQPTGEEESAEDSGNAEGDCDSDDN